MKKKISILLIMALVLFAFVPALTMAQDDLDDQNTVAEETVDENGDETADDSEEDGQDIEDEEQTEEQTDEESEEETEAGYQNLEELLADLEANEDLSSVERITLKRKLTEYDESLEIDSISSVVDKILAEEIELGEGFVILRNLEESVNNGFEEERAVDLINSYQDQENSGQFAFQTALELRKLSREDSNGEMTEEFAEKINSILEEEGSIETSELKQLAAEFRKEAREEKREQMKADREKEQNSASEKSFDKDKSNNASENAVNKDNKGKGNSDNSKAKDKGKDNSSNKSGNSNSNSNNNSKK